MVRGGDSLTTRFSLEASELDLEIIHRIKGLPHRRHLLKSDKPPNVLLLNLSGSSDSWMLKEAGEMERVVPFRYLNRRSLKLIRPLKHQREILEEAINSKQPVSLEAFMLKAADTIIARGALECLNVVPLVLLPEDIPLGSRTINHPQAVAKGIAFAGIRSGFRLAAVKFFPVPQEKQLFRPSRLWKDAAHEAGHILGLWRHCRDSQCLMHKSSCRGHNFCARCLTKLERTYRWLQL